MRVFPASPRLKHLSLARSRAATKFKDDQLAEYRGVIFRAMKNRGNGSIQHTRWDEREDRFSRRKRRLCSTAGWLPPSRATFPSYHLIGCGKEIKNTRGRGGWAPTRVQQGMGDLASLISTVDLRITVIRRLVFFSHPCRTNHKCQVNMWSLGPQPRLLSLHDRPHNVILQIPSTFRASRQQNTHTRSGRVSKLARLGEHHFSCWS